jgi:fucose 4-O-acetylase-like acetyltransferase
MNERATWVDYGKGIGILLVVYAHLLSSAYHAGIVIPQQFFKLSDSIIYSFHMPFFFFLSGLFVQESLHKRGTKNYLTDKFSRIAYPYLIWSILQVSVEILFSDQTQKGASIENLLAIAYRPWGQFWFLYVLLLMHILFACLSLFGKHTRPLLIVIATILYFNPIQIGFMSIANVCTYFIFFSSGIIFKEFFMSMQTYNRRVWLALILLVTFITSAFYVFTNLIEPIRLGGRVNIYYFMGLSILGIFTFCAISQYLSHTKRFSFLQTLGKYSLQIYLVHMLAGVGMRMLLLHGFAIENWIVHILLGTAFALLAPIIIEVVSGKINFPYFFQLKHQQKSE